MKYLFLLTLVPFLLTACTEPGETWYVEVECGNGTCGDDETCSSCEVDCGVCPEPVCGDGDCNGDEDCSSCEDDCGVCPDPVCGDGACDVGEDEDTCPADCAVAGPCIDFESAHTVFENNNCLGCHKGAAAANFGALDLDTYETFLAGGASGAAYVDGDGAISNIVTKLKTDTNPFGSVMPLGNADSVSDEDIQTLIDWIDGGVVEVCEEEPASECGDGTCDDGEDETSCPEDCTPAVPCVDFATVLAVFETYSCTGCHGFSGNLDLGEWEEAIGEGSNGFAVVPGDHASSNLYTKCTDDVPFGSKMPLNALGPVTDDDLQIIADWIDSGANETCD